MFVRRFAFSLTLAALLVAGCISERRDWVFVQSVGGIAVGNPHRTPSGVMLPVSVDVSGLRTITTKPSTVNSGLAIKAITVRREADTLRLTLVTTVAGGDARSSIAEVPLGDLERGRYRVVYAEPNGGRIGMGEITVP
jgi:hypothetical protein